MNERVKKTNNLNLNPNPSLRFPKKTESVLKFAVYALLLVASALCMNESRGFFRTLPAMLILPGMATLFYNKKTLTAALCFIITLILSAAENASVSAAAMTALSALIFASVSIFIKRLAVTAAVNIKKRRFCGVAATILFVTGIIVYALIFGNPVSFFLANYENSRYIAETYAEGAPRICYTYYDFDEGRWFTRVSFRDDAEMSADISVYGEKAETVDGYSNYYEYKYLSARRNELARLLSETASEQFGQCAVRINTEKTEIAAYPGADAENFYSQMVFDIAFYDQLTDEASFSEKCRIYHEYIMSAGFDFGTINYYGGFADEFLFEASVKNGFEGEFGTLALAEPFSENGFDRYYDESDYADHWSYGKS